MSSANLEKVIEAVKALSADEQIQVRRLIDGLLSEANAAGSEIKMKRLEAQLRNLLTQLQSDFMQPETAKHSFAELYGILHGKADSTEEEIDAALYKLPGDLENPA